MLSFIILFFLPSSSSSSFQMAHCKENKKKGEGKFLDHQRRRKVSMTSKQNHCKENLGE